MKNLRPSLALALLTLAVQTGVEVRGQGVAVPKRPPRQAPAPKLDIPLPKVHFEDVASKAGLAARHVTGQEREKRYILETVGSGVALFDYNNDGWLDIFLVNGTTFEGFPKGQEPTNHLYRNNKDGTFTDVTAQTNLVRSGWGQGVCVGDYDNDGYDDLFVTYFGQTVLYRNNGDGTFTDVSEKSGVAGPAGHYAFTPAVSDYDNDGWPDIYVACDSTPNLLYHNEGNGTFTDAGMLSGSALNEDGQEQAGMGVSAADYDSDGFIDLVKTNFTDDTSTL